MKPNFVLGVTGASGAAYAVRLLRVLCDAGCQIDLSISPSGQAVIKQELGIELDLERFDLARLLPEGALSGTVRYHDYRDMLAPMASGSHRTAGMVICPCSGSTLSAVAHGASTNLIHRAADVHLKERRKLVLVPRETPLSVVYLDNMRRCAEAGAVVLPAVPGFYHSPRTIDDLVDFVVARICDQLAVEHSLMRRWGES
jgi:flavin prenyltransferase